MDVLLVTLARLLGGRARGARGVSCLSPAAIGQWSLGQGNSGKGRCTTVRSGVKRRGFGGVRVELPCFEVSVFPMAVPATHSLEGARTHRFEAENIVADAYGWSTIIPHLDVFLARRRRREEKRIMLVAVTVTSHGSPTSTMSYCRARLTSLLDVIETDVTTQSIVVGREL